MGRSSAARPRRRRALGAIALVVALAAVWLGAWGLQRWAPFAHGAAEVTWPANIVDLATFVESTAHASFLEPVAVQFDDGTGAYDALMYVPPATEEDMLLAKTQDAVGRALGMWNGDASTTASDAALNSAPSLAQWFRDGNVLAVDAHGGDAQLGPLQRSEIVLQLTIALDEQHHHLVERRLALATRTEAQAMVAVGLGHAVWVHDQYIDEFSDADRADYFDEVDEKMAGYSDGMDIVPPAFRALRLAAQRVGPMFVAALLEEGHRALADALGDEVPTALDQVTLPFSKYVRRDEVEPVSAPAVPIGAQFEFSTQGGPLLLFLMASTGAAANDALTAADGWGNDAYTVYRLDGRVCLDMHVVADSRADADLIEQALAAWAGARPAEADALIGRRGTHLYATTCDPGADVQQITPDASTIDQFFGRIDMITGQIQQGSDPAVAECVAVEFFGRYSLVELRSDELQIDVVGEVDAIAAECAAAV